MKVQILRTEVVDIHPLLRMPSARRPEPMCMKIPPMWGYDVARPSYGQYKFYFRSNLLIWDDYGQNLTV